jgi:hypothetical protein
MVPEAEHAQAARLEIAGAAGIATFAMLSSICLDDQLSFHAKEVGDVRSDGDLAPELKPGELAVAETLPEEFLCFGCVLP